MDSKRDTRTLLLALTAVVLSALLIRLNADLQPCWWAAWLAPLPLLWIAPRLSWKWASLTAIAATLGGTFSMWSYYGRLQIPVPIRVIWMLLPAFALCLGVLLFRALFRRGSPLLAALAFPALGISWEYLTSLVFGTYGATGYTQTGYSPVLWLGGFAGLWGIGFAVLLFPALLAAILLDRAGDRRTLSIAMFVVFGFLVSYNFFGVGTLDSDEPHVIVGMAASDLPQNTFPQDDANAMRLLREYAEQVPLLAQRQAQIVVLPELIAVVSDAISGDVDRLYQQTAREAKVRVLLGVRHVTPQGTFNEARYYSADGAIAAVYRKHHLVPGLEASTTPGAAISVLREPFGTVGLAICRDMDYPEPSRRYGWAGINLLLVPAWDFDVDRYWHGRMATMRGVENGFNMVRAARDGLLMVSDAEGRVRVETPTSRREPFTTVVAQAPLRHHPTLYQLWGDWFAWLNLALLAALLAKAVVARSKAPVGAAA